MAALKLDHLSKLFVGQLKDAYSAERQLVEALPKMRDAASSEKLANAFADHLQQTRVHVERLQKIFEELDFSPGGHRCKAMEGLIEEGKEVVTGDAEGNVKDAALICAAQKVEHYEIALYGCLRSWANLQGMTRAAELLQQTLDEECKADNLLSELAEQWVNAFAMHA